MKKITLLLITTFLFACGGNKKVIQNTQKKDAIKIESKEEKTETPKPDIHIKERAIDTKIKEIEPQEEKIDKISQQIEQTPKKKLTTVNHQPWDNLLAQYVSKEGTVNYKSLKQNRSALKSYLKILSENTPAETWSKNDKLAYWMNVYNAFTIKLIIDNYPVKSIKDIKNPWDLRFFKLGEKWYTLNDVEHRILRKMNDPRIHFGINCASFSCPPLLNKAFTAQNVNLELEKLAVNFINDPKRNTITPDKVQLSKLFLWFAKDFKIKGTLIEFLNKYAKISINNNPKKSFKTYDWNLNE